MAEPVGGEEEVDDSAEQSSCKQPSEKSVGRCRSSMAARDNSGTKDRNFLKQVNLFGPSVMLRFPTPLQHGKPATFGM
jgi:hypothetical protein